MDAARERGHCCMTALPCRVLPGHRPRGVRRRPSGSPQVCQPPCWHSANPNQVERWAWTRVFAPLLPLCTKSAGGEQGRCSSGCPGRTRRAGNVGAGLPGLAALWAVGSRDEIGPPLFPAPSRAPAAAPDTRGACRTPCTFFQQLSKRSCPASSGHQLRFSSCWNTKRG